MDLELSQEQEMVRDTVSGLVQKFCPLDVVRQLEDDPFGYSDNLWQQLADSGVTGMLIPEEYGGSSMTMLDAAVAYIEFGRSLAPTPHFVSSVMAAGVLLHAGTDAQKQAWLPKLADGSAVITTAWMEPDRGFGPDGVALAATADGEGFVLTGTKRHVTFASAADRLLVLAKSDAGLLLALVDPKADGVTLTQQFSVSSDTQYRVDFKAVKVSAADVIGAAGSGWETWDAVMRDGLILLAAQAAGGARYSLEITTQYAKDRKQFDKPLGAFQALAHYLADAVTTVDGAEALVFEAAWARTEGRSVAKLAPMAKLFACQTYRDVTAMAQQVFGGIGFTVDFDIQLYFRRAKQLQITWWDDRYLEELVAEQLLAEAAARAS